MTVRSVSWTDAASVARLLARVTGPRRVAAPPVARAAVAAPAPAAAPKPAPQVAPPARVVPKLEQGSDNPSDRLDALLAWTLDHHRCDGAFVADDNGLTLAAHGVSEAQVSLVGPLLSALVAVRSIPGIDASSGALWLGSSMMSWVEARTERGGFCLGAVGAEALATEDLNQLKEALELTVRDL
ncbi:MAG TPA: hypothetical protein VHB79_07825 [Polyangiaceae bacterium]|nr:hypothetical protein [Polyangiaceae bacterium]